ncbi:Hdx [Phodopus roborovskii]|uniref:Highly divergent homeobox n=1 Tax=Phodopus roborovskii TaxID=109678 RepID=A0AAU9YQH9_PHORO|nr:Hdx [Phodopus roborovskii]
MNLRSVFTVEQQRILQRYYENGMTNQSKNCFQLILQCAQETKLDFSVVRTWVGNKRRKMSSKNSESGTAGTVSGTSLAAPDITVRNVVNIARPSSQQSSWTSASNDVIVTGIYSPASSSSKQGTTKHANTQITEAHKIPIQKPASKNDTEFQLHIPVQRQVAHCKNASVLLGEKTIILSRQTSVLNAGNSVYNHTKKNYGSSPVQASEMTVPQKPSVCHRPCKIEPVGIQRSYKPEHAGLASHNLLGQKPAVRDPYCRTQNLEIREVFSLAVSDYPQRIMGGNTTQKPGSAEGTCLSIAMETGDAEDEYAREEELASMGAQITSYSRLYESGNSFRAENQSTTLPGPGRNLPNSQMVNIRDLSDNVLYQNRDYHLTPRTSLHTASSTMYNNTNPSRSNFSPHFVSSNQLRLSQNQNNYQISGNLTVPWITGCSRKRAFFIDLTFDKTEFSQKNIFPTHKWKKKNHASSFPLSASICQRPCPSGLESSMMSDHMKITSKNIEIKSDLALSDKQVRTQMVNNFSKQVQVILKKKKKKKNSSIRHYQSEINRSIVLKNTSNIYYLLLVHVSILIYFKNKYLKSKSPSSTTLKTDSGKEERRARKRYHNIWSHYRF